MARNALTGQKIGAVFVIVLGVVFFVLGTWGPFKGDLGNGRKLPVNWGGVVAIVLGILALALGPTKRDP